VHAGCDQNLTGQAGNGPMTASRRMFDATGKDAVPPEIPPAREQTRRFRTALNPVSNRHYLFSSGRNYFIHFRALNYISAGEPHSNVDSAIVLCSSELYTERLRRSSIESLNSAIVRTVSPPASHRSVGGDQVAPMAKNWNPPRKAATCWT
jgi:hypothetical protein